MAVTDIEFDGINKELSALSRHDDCPPSPARGVLLAYKPLLALSTTTAASSCHRAIVCTSSGPSHDEQCFRQISLSIAIDLVVIVTTAAVAANDCRSGSSANETSKLQATNPKHRT